MNKFASFVVLNPKLIVALSFVLTAIFATALGIYGIQFNGSPDMLARNDEALNFFKETQATFGSDAVLICALEANDIFTVEAKERLDHLTNLFAAQHGVANAVSLSNVTAIKGDKDGIVIDKLIPQTSQPRSCNNSKARQRTTRFMQKITSQQTDGRRQSTSFCNPCHPKKFRPFP